MVSAIATDKLACNFLIKNYDHDPGTNAAKVISADGGTTEIWFDLRDYDQIGFLVCAPIGTTQNCSLLEIVASDAENEDDSSVTVVKASSALTVNLVAEGAFQECTAEEVAQLASTYNLRYVTARITLNGHATDNECQVIVFAHVRRPHDAVSAASW
jgi:hypothetical protein